MSAEQQPHACAVQVCCMVLRRQAAARWLLILGGASCSSSLAPPPPLPAPPPPAAGRAVVTMHPGANNVGGSAWKASSSTVKYLGQYNTTEQCEWACLRGPPSRGRANFASKFLDAAAPPLEVPFCSLLQQSVAVDRTRVPAEINSAPSARPAAPRLRVLRVHIPHRGVRARKPAGAEPNLLRPPGLSYRCIPKTLHRCDNRNGERVSADWGGHAQGWNRQCYGVTDGRWAPAAQVRAPGPGGAPCLRIAFLSRMRSPPGRSLAVCMPRRPGR